MLRLTRVILADHAAGAVTEQDARQADERLVEEFSHTTIPKQVWPEILGMSLEGRKALAAYLTQQVEA